MNRRSSGSSDCYCTPRRNLVPPCAGYIARPQRNRGFLAVLDKLRRHCIRDATIGSSNKTGKIPKSLRKKARME